MRSSQEVAIESGEAEEDVGETEDDDCDSDQEKINVNTKTLLYLVADADPRRERLFMMLKQTTHVAASKPQTVCLPRTVPKSLNCGQSG